MPCGGVGIGGRAQLVGGLGLPNPCKGGCVVNVSRDTIYREIERGALPVRHVGRQLRIDPLDFRHYLERGSEP